MKSYVSAISFKGSNRLEIKCHSQAAAETLETLGGKRNLFNRSTWLLSYKDDSELASALSALRDADFAMLGQPHGWPPASVFDYLREQGLIEGVFEEITFSGSGRASFQHR